jgi:hypothetical protein
MSWINWYRTISPKPSMISFPRTKESLQSIIKNANTYKRKLKIINHKKDNFSNQSLSELSANLGYLEIESDDKFADKEFLISLDGLSQVLDLNTNTMEVKVESGIKINSLISKLEKDQLTLPNLTSNLDQSIFHAVSYADHGSGSNFPGSSDINLNNRGSFSNFVTNIEYVDVEGNIVSVNATNSPNIFRALQTNLGSCALIYSFTLKCIPLLILDVKNINTKYELITSTWEALQSKYKYFQFSINPISGNTNIFLINQSEDNLNGYLKSKTNNNSETNCEKITNKIINLSDNILNYLDKKSNNIISHKENLSELTDIEFKNNVKKYNNLHDQSNKVLSLFSIENKNSSSIKDKTLLLAKDNLKSEICIDVKDLVSAIVKVLDFCQKNNQNNNQNDYQNNNDVSSGNKGNRILSITCRFVDKGTSYLDPAINDNNVYILAIMKNEPQNIDQLYGFNDLFTEFNGRPSWKGIHNLTKDQIVKLYGQNLVDFKTIRDELDPQRLLVNTHLQKLGF